MDVEVFNLFNFVCNIYKKLFFVIVNVFENDMVVGKVFYWDERYIYIFYNYLGYFDG